MRKKFWFAYATLLLFGAEGVHAARDWCRVVGLGGLHEEAVQEERKEKALPRSCRGSLLVSEILKRCPELAGSPESIARQNRTAREKGWRPISTLPSKGLKRIPRDGVGYYIRAEVRDSHLYLRSDAYHKLKDLAKEFRATFGRDLRIGDMTRTLREQTFLVRQRKTTADCRIPNRCSPHVMGGAVFDISIRDSLVGSGKSRRIRADRAEEFFWLIEQILPGEFEGTLEVTLEPLRNNCIHVMVVGPSSSPTAVSSP